jgi:hypothetical protein
VEFDEILLQQLEKEFIEETFLFEQVDEVEILEPKAKKVELKPLPDHVKYQFLDSDERSPVIVSSLLNAEQNEALLHLLRRHRKIIGYAIEDMIGIDPSICTHRIYLEEGSIPVREHQRRLNPQMHEVSKKEVLILLGADIIYPISDSEWVSPVHVVPKKSGITLEEIATEQDTPAKKIAKWRLVTDYRKLNKATRKDHFPLPFIDQMLERLAGHKYFCYLDGYSGFLQIPIHPKDQDKTTFTCPYGTFAYKRLPFGLCNAPGTFQRCMLSIFSDLIESKMEVFMDDFTVYGHSFEECLNNLELVLERCSQHNLVLN